MLSPLSSPITRDGDTQFIGLQSRRNPLTIPPGYLQGAKNIRLELGIPTVRGGGARLATGIDVAEIPLTVPFVTTETSPIVRTLYTGGLFGGTVFSSPDYFAGKEYIVLVGPDVLFLWDVVTGDLTTLNYPSSPISEIVMEDDLIQVLQAFGQLYFFRWRASDISQAVSSIAQVSGVASITTPVAHGYVTGEVVRLSGSDQAGFNLDAVITVTSSTTFTVAVPSATDADGSSGATTRLIAQRVCVPLVWDGASSSLARVPTGTSPLGPTFSQMVSPFNAVALYFNNMLLLATSKDTLGVSDTNDLNTYDPLLKSFRANFGDNDALVALHPFAQGNVIVLKAKSVYLAKLVISSDGTAIDPTQSSLQLVTGEIGCVAQHTVVTAGKFIYFLSANGVYSLDNSRLDLLLTGNTLPLSEPIDDVMQTINPDAIAFSSAAYFNNRLYLAVPTNGSTTCNTLLIYNLLNSAWESVDGYPWSIDQMMTATHGNKRRLFAVSYTAGALFLMEEYATGQDDSATGPMMVDIDSEITTRRFFWNVLAKKRFNSVACSCYMPPGTSVAITVQTINPDNTTEVLNFTNTTGVAADFTLKAPIRRSAEYVDVTISAAGGQPTIRDIQIDAATTIDPSRLVRTER